MKEIDFELLQQAFKRTIPSGFKPEDYFQVEYSDEIPKRIAILVVKEYFYLLKLRQFKNAKSVYQKQDV